MGSENDGFNEARSSLSTISGITDNAGDSVMDYFDGIKLREMPIRKSYGKVNARLKSGVGLALAIGAGAVAQRAEMPLYAQLLVANTAYDLSSKAMSGSALSALAIVYSKDKRNAAKERKDTGYVMMKTGIAKKANTPGGANSKVSFEVGGLEHPNQPSHSVQVSLNGGYSVNVMMDTKSPSEKRNTVKNTPFTVDETTEFRARNRHVSSSSDERESVYVEKMKGLGVDELSHIRDKETASYQENELKQAPFQELIEELEKNPDNKDLYLTVSGAPYQYDSDTGKMLPSSVRYSGESLKEILTIADRSSKLASIDSEEAAKMDIVDLAYAHGLHSQEVQEKGTRFTNPEYVVDGGTPEIKTNKNWGFHIGPHLTSMSKGIKALVQKTREFGGKFINKHKKELDVIDANMNAIADYASTDFMHDELGEFGSVDQELSDVPESPDSPYNTVVEMDTLSDKLEQSNGLSPYNLSSDESEPVGLNEEIETERSESIIEDDPIAEKPTVPLADFLREAYVETINEPPSESLAIISIQDRYVKTSLAESASKESKRQSGDPLPYSMS